MKALDRIILLTAGLIPVMVWAFAIILFIFAPSVVKLIGIAVVIMALLITLIWLSEVLDEFKPRNKPSRIKHQSGGL